MQLIGVAHSVWIIFSKSWVFVTSTNNDESFAQLCAHATDPCMAMAHCLPSHKSIVSGFAISSSRNAWYSFTIRVHSFSSPGSADSGRLILPCKSLHTILARHQISTILRRVSKCRDLQVGCADIPEIEFHASVSSLTLSLYTSLWHFASIPDFTLTLSGMSVDNTRTAQACFAQVAVHSRPSLFVDVCSKGKKSTQCLPVSRVDRSIPSLCDEEDDCQAEYGADIALR